MGILYLHSAFLVIGVLQISWVLFKKRKLIETTTFRLLLLFVSTNLYVAYTGYTCAGNTCGGLILHFLYMLLSLIVLPFNEIAMFIKISEKTEPNKALQSTASGGD